MESWSRPKRFNIIDLKTNHCEKFGRFIMALKHLQESDDWSRICGIHGNTFKPNDPGVLCPTDTATVTRIGETGEPFYCKHGVYSFIAWHTPYIYQFELMLNKYNKSDNSDYITLPYIDLTDFSVDFSFINEPTIDIFYNKRLITIENPLAGAYYYVDGKKTKTVRKGFLTPRTKKERSQLKTIKKQLNNALYAPNYEQFSSLPVTKKPSNIVVDYVPLETPHNQLHDIFGGKGGNMSDISISAFDPLFWLHHCNMDRHYYSWLYNNTEKFTKSIYPDKMLDKTYNYTFAPFNTQYVYSRDADNYLYGWLNNSGSYLLLKDALNFKKFPYSYEIIKPTPKQELKAFIELIDIRIPPETLNINAYLYPKTMELNKELHYAGSGTWFGINRKEKFCPRCEVTLTNIKIDIEEYVLENKITSANKDDYNLVLEGEGSLVLDKLGYKSYSQSDLLSGGGSLQIIIR